MYLSFAWRNIWRNKKRTVIVAASIFFGVILACLMRSSQLGSYSYMIHSAAKMQTGYLQIQDEEYWENRSLNNSIVIADTLWQAWQEVGAISSLTPRLESYALISTDSITKVSPVVGTRPNLEAQMTEVDKKLVAGEWIADGDSSAILAEGLADRLNVAIGDTVVLYGSGYQGMTAAAKVPVKGLVKLPFPQLNNAMVFLPLDYAQWVFVAPGRVTSVAVMLDNIRDLEAARAALQQHMAQNMVLKSWDELMPEMEQSIEIDNASGIIMIGILYLVIAFGVFGTIMMMTAEREKEWGILNAVGMRKSRMVAISILESIAISFLGTLLGIAGSIPITVYFKNNPIRLSGDMAFQWEVLGLEPILPFSADPGIFLYQSLVVLGIALLCSIYPLLFINRLQPVKALRK